MYARPWRRIRDFVMLKILDMLSGGPMHGYAIMKRLEEEFAVKMSPGLVYPILREMRGMGLVVSRESGGDGRKTVLYEITGHGLEFLESRRSELELFEKRFSRIRYCGLLLAMERLREILERIDGLSDSELERVRRAVEVFLENTRGVG